VIVSPLPIDIDDWILAGDVAEQHLYNIANAAKDTADTKLDAKRTHNGMTLAEYLAR
jgi:hypothetical protein